MLEECLCNENNNLDGIWTVFGNNKINLFTFLKVFRAHLELNTSSCNLFKFYKIQLIKVKHEGLSKSLKIQIYHQDMDFCLASHEIIACVLDS